MGRKPVLSNKALCAALGLVLLAIFLAFIAPEEKTLGSYIRLIYIHAAVTWVGLAMFAISGLLGLLYFAGYAVGGPETSQRIKTATLNYSSASQVSAILFWTASVVLGAFAASLTWGGNWWIEPRLRVAAFILVLAFVMYQLRGLVAHAFLKAVVNVGLPVSALVLLASTGKLVHPDNAFAKSDSVEIKLFAAGIAVVFAMVSAIITHSLARARQQQSELELAGL